MQPTLRPEQILRDRTDPLAFPGEFMYEQKKKTVCEWLL